MTERTITALQRSTTGKASAKHTRKNGMIPAVVYGGNKQPISISIGYRAFQRQLNVEHSLLTKPFSLTIDSKKPESILIRAIQFHPVTDAILSLEMMRVTPRTKTKVLVNVHIEDATTATVIKQGGVLNILRHDVELFGPISSIPEVLSIEIKDRTIGDTIRMSDFPLPSNVHPTIKDRDFVIASIMAPKIQSIVEEEEEQTTEEITEEET